MRSSEDRYFSAYQAYNRAQNPKWKAYWLSLMNHFKKDFN